MAYLSKDERDILALARSVIRDLSFDYGERDLACSPKEICDKLSAVLREKYDFDTNEAVPFPQEEPTPAVIELGRGITEAHDRANELCYAGYHLLPIQLLNVELFLEDPAFEIPWVLQGTNPVVQAKVQTTSMQSALLELQQKFGQMPMGFGVPGVPTGGR